MGAADIVNAPRERWRAFAVSAALVLALGTAVAASAASGAAGLAERNALEVLAGRIDTDVLTPTRDVVGIGLRNLGVCAVLVAGTSTLGLVTVVVLVVVAMSVGLSGAAVAGALGVAEMLHRIAPYVVLEAGGVLLAAVAGLLPIVHAARARAAARGFWRSYAQGIVHALGLMPVAAILIVLGACVETVVIQQHA